MICKETIWITGASSGIGRAIALQLAQQGNKIIASGRNRQALAQLAEENDNIFTMICDLLTDDGRSIKQALCELAHQLDRIILSAGDCQYLDIEKDDWSCIKHNMDINFHGSVKAIQAALPLLKKSPHGHIVGISSMASLAPFTQAEAYGASKAALSYFLSALRIDLQAKHIDISDIKPGFIDTPLTRKNDFSMPFLLSPDAASKRIIKAIEKRKFNYVFPKRLYIVFKLIALFPSIWLSVAAKQTKQKSES